KRVQGSRVRIRWLGGGNVIREKKDGQRWHGPTHSPRSGLPLRRLLRNFDRRRAALPWSIILTRKRDQLVMLHIAGHDDRAVLREIPQVEKYLAISKLVGHVFYVVKKADRRVLVRMFRIGCVLRHFAQLE